MNGAEPLLQVKGLTTHLFTDAGVVRAVDDVSLYIKPGEAMGLVGESGCGKSMTAMSLMRLVRTPGKIISGKVHFKGIDLLALSEPEMRQIRGGEIGMVFQDPMTFLNPLMRVGDQVTEAIKLHQNVRKHEAWDLALEALKRVRIPAPETVIYYYPHQLSGGMRQRVLIAMAISCQPALLIADEPTTAIDVTIQAQIMKVLKVIRSELGSAMLLITHDLGLIAEYCERVYVMYAGRIVEESDIFTLFSSPKHPYTQCLLESTLSIDYRVDTFETIAGQPPSLITPPSGCRFHPRCPRAFDRCSREEPPPYSLGEGQWARCWLYEGAKP
jgi:oligopeptide/dipeptide ABC transporter ATP-binding protein